MESPFGRGITQYQEDLRSPWLLTIYKSWDDPPSNLKNIHVYLYLEPQIVLYFWWLVDSAKAQLLGSLGFQVVARVFVGHSFQNNMRKWKFLRIMEKKQNNSFCFPQIPSQKKVRSWKCPQSKLHTLIRARVDQLLMLGMVLPLGM